MRLPEIYIKLSVNFADDPKMVELSERFGGEAAAEAQWLFFRMATYSKRMGTDGVVRSGAVPILAAPLSPDRGRELVGHLSDVSLIQSASKALASASGLLSEHAKHLLELASDSDTEAWLLPAFVKWNGTRAEAEYLAEMKADAGRRGGIQRARNRRSANGSEPASRRLAAASGLVGQSSSKTLATQTQTQTDTTPLPPLPAPQQHATDPERETDTDTWTTGRLNAVVIAELRERLGWVVDGTTADKIRADVIGARQVANPVAYLRAAIRQEPDPHRWLPVTGAGTRPRRTAGPRPVGVVLNEANAGRTATPQGDPAERAHRGAAAVKEAFDAARAKADAERAAVAAEAAAKAPALPDPAALRARLAEDDESFEPLDELDTTGLPDDEIPF